VKSAKVRSTRTAEIQECCDALGISPDLLRDYVARGCPHDKGGPGKSNRFDPTEVAAWMRSNNLTGKPGRPVEAGGEDLESVRIRKETAMAVNWEYRNKQLEGELVNKEEYRRLWIGEVQTIKNKCRGLGSSLGAGAGGVGCGRDPGAD
jgi:phage terminase Nu1 subunit (DNA packaging protein)